MRHLQALSASRSRPPALRGALSTACGCLLALALFAIPASGSDPGDAPRAVLVLDASASMWAPLDDGTLRMAAARLTTLDLLDALGGADPPLSLRTFGGAVPDDGQQDPCTITTAAPEGEARSALQDLAPGGVAPLIRALRSAVDDLGDAAGGAGIVLVTSTPDQCHADAGPLLERLRAADPPVTVRVVGLGLSAEEAEAFSAVTSTRNATTTVELAEALRWAASDLGLEVSPAASVRLEVAPGDAAWSPEELTVRAVHLASGDEILLDRQGDDHVGAVSAGAHLLRLYDSDDASPLATLLVRAAVGRSTRVELPLLLPDPPEITWREPPPTAGGEAVILLDDGTDLHPLWLAAEPASSPDGAWTTRTTLPPGTTEAVVPLVDRPLTVEARLWTDLAEGVSMLMGRQPADLAEPEVELVAPERLETDRPTVLEWSGPAIPGDRVTMARPQAAAVDHELCVSASDDGVAAVVTPGRPGTYEVRYVSGRSLRVLHRVPVELFKVPARLWSAVQATAGGPLEVHWDGPDAPTDFVTIVPVDAPTGTYTSFAPTSEGNPVSLQCPRSPGEYEVRYVAGRSGATLAERPLRVLAIPATVTGPGQAPAGGRVEVRWEGPDATEDMITIARPDWPARRSLDWSYTAMGSPLSLAAPDEPGRYELRYVSGDDQQILARTTVQVR